MKLKNLDLVCPKCKKGATVKIDLCGGVSLKCSCHSTLAHFAFRFVISEWVAYLGEIGSFKDYENLVKRSK